MLHAIGARDRLVMNFRETLFLLNRSLTGRELLARRANVVRRRRQLFCVVIRAQFRGAFVRIDTLP
jgi:hypothetical protein